MRVSRPVLRGPVGVIPAGYSPTVIRPPLRAPQRALGFALTFYPSVFMLLLVLARLAWGTLA